MKKITLLFFLLTSMLQFSQEPIDKIKNYVNENKVKFGLTSQDISDLVIVNDFSSETTGINNYHVKQRISGIEVFNSDSNFWIKNNEVINGGEEFISNLIQKTNTSTPSLSVTDALMGVLSQIGENQLNSVQILESGSNKYKLSNGALVDVPIRAQLVYFQTESNTFKLSWDYEFYSQNGNHLWNIKVDAITGKLLEKKDMTLSCNFDSKHQEHSHNVASINLIQKLYKDNASNILLTPGTTNYNVIPWNYESPNHSARQVVTNPESTAVASPNGWHNANTTIGGTGVVNLFNYTRGNNVMAYSDFTNAEPSTIAAVANTAAATSGTYPNLTFNYPYGGTQTSPKTYIKAATTNLFYMNNIMHDLWYQYGFNEANKNFQAANLGRAATGGNDPVNAEAQDASTGNDNPNTAQGEVLGQPKFNNANFSTPADGTRPKMQMYIWNAGKKLSNLTVTSGTLNGTSYQVIENSFNEGHVHLPADPSVLTGQLQLVNDGSPDTSDACADTTTGATLPAGSMAGKIAVIRRGSCPFNIKTKAVQDAGAIAAIIVNNAAGTISMSGDNAAITIPSISMTQADGEALIASLSNGTVTVNLSSPDTYGFADGDFDNGIIAHEYGHGISTRLSGNCLGGQEQQGEGWSDWFWLMMQIKPGDTRNDARGIGTFANNQPTNGQGIREYRYSTDMAVNPHTYASTNTAVVPHGIGSIWAAILWDLTWNYIDLYGYDSNIYTGTGGNNKVMRLVLDAIKLDGCNPTFITARDAIIAADQATTGGQNFCLIWKTFARRGVGVNASSGSTGSITDQIEDFTEPAPGPNCFLGINYFQNEDMIRIYPNPSNGQINIRINQFIGKVNLQVIDLNGRVVYSLNDTDFNIEKSINLNHLQSGMYVVKINGSELNYTKKIILN